MTSSNCQILKIGDIISLYAEGAVSGFISTLGYVITFSFMMQYNSNLLHWPARTNLCDWIRKGNN